MLLIELPRDIITAISLQIEHLDSYLNWLSTCKTIASIDNVIHQAMKERLIRTTLTIDDYIAEQNIYHDEITCTMIKRADGDILHGKYSIKRQTIFDSETVSLISSGQYVNNQRHGPWVTENKSYIIEFSYHHGQVHGLLEMKIKSANRVELRNFYINGQIAGPRITYHVFRRDTPISSRCYYENGQAKELLIYEYHPPLKRPTYWPIVVEPKKYNITESVLDQILFEVFNHLISNRINKLYRILNDMSRQVRHGLLSWSPIKVNK